MSLTLNNVVRNFPDWNFEQCNAYKAGALAGLRKAPIREGFEYDPQDADQEEDLTLHFFYGYADAFGEEVDREEWYEEIVDWRIVYRWWEEAADVRNPD